MQFGVVALWLLLLVPILGLVTLLLWLFLMWKAYSGERYELPVVAEFAKKLAYYREKLAMEELLGSVARAATTEEAERKAADKAERDDLRSRLEKLEAKPSKPDHEAAPKGPDDDHDFQL